MEKLAILIVSAILLFSPETTGYAQKVQWDKGALQKKSTGNQKQWDKSAYQQKAAGDQKKAIAQDDKSQKGKKGGSAYSPEIMAQKAQWVKSLEPEKVTDEMKEWIESFELTEKGKVSIGDLELAKTRIDDSLPKSFSAIFKNNIFDPNRRPGGPVAKVERKAPTPPKVMYIELTGVLIFSDGAVAFFEGSSPFFSGPREKGEEIAGMILTDVSTDQVILAKEDHETILPVGSRYGTWGDGEWRVVLAPSRPFERMPLTSLAAARSKKGGKDTWTSEMKKKAEDWIAMSNREKLEVYQKTAKEYMNSEKGWGTNVQFRQMGNQMVKMVQEEGSTSWDFSVFDPNMYVEK